MFGKYKPNVIRIRIRYFLKKVTLLTALVSWHAHYVGTNELICSTLCTLCIMFLYFVFDFFSAFVFYAFLLLLPAFW